MLDECKGEKFYEILAIFSNAALKKVLGAQQSSVRDEAIARKIAVTSTLSARQQQSLLPLAIAHKAALVNILRRKEQKRRRYLEFEALLDRKTEDVNRRIRKSKDTPRAKRPAVPQRDADAIKKQLKDNWIGNQKWLDVMLHGDYVQAGEAWLGSRFDKVWRMVEHGRKLEDVTPEAGLLENLQSRVQEQQDRLEEDVSRAAQGGEERAGIENYKAFWGCKRVQIRGSFAVPVAVQQAEWIRAKTDTTPGYAIGLRGCVGRNEHRISACINCEAKTDGCSFEKEAHLVTPCTVAGS
jgi:hypothetical protein